MADKKLNEVQKVTDMAYVPVILADGSVGQIAKADLATVVAGIILKSDTAIRGYGGSEHILRLIILKGTTGYITFEIISKKSDIGSTVAKSECSLLFVNGTLIASDSTNVHGLCYHSDGEKIIIYGNHNNLQYAYLGVSIKGGMGFVNHISAADPVSLPSGVITI